VPGLPVGDIAARAVRHAVSVTRMAKRPGLSDYLPQIVR
jgi:hypothetical protein